jgi:hypothetical protein
MDAFAAIPNPGRPPTGASRSIIGQPAVGGPDFHLCEAPLILHPATYMQRLIFFLHVFGPDKMLPAIRR